MTRTIVKVRTARTERRCQSRTIVCAQTISPGIRYRLSLVPPGDPDLGNTGWWARPECGACAAFADRPLPHPLTAAADGMWLDDSGSGGARCGGPECSGRIAPVELWRFAPHDGQDGRSCPAEGTTLRGRMAWLIWSHHHRVWHGPDGKGYYAGISGAGRFHHRDVGQWLRRGCGCCSVPDVAIPDVPESLYGTPELTGVIRGRIRIATAAARRTSPNQFFAGRHDRSRV